MGRTLVGTLIALILMSACGTSGTPGSVVEGTSSYATAVSSPPRTNASNPCLSEGGPAEPPGSVPTTEGYLGLTQNEAKSFARDNGQDLRVAGRDGECFALTMDYRPNRVNVYLENSEVVAASIG